MIKNITMVVPANGSAKNATIQGNFIRCLNSDNSSVMCRLLYENGRSANSEFQLEKGLGFETKPFYGLQLKNETASDINISMIVSDEGAVIDTRTSGALSIGAAASISYIDPAISTSDTVLGIEVFSLNVYRKSATFTVDADCYVNNVGGLEIEAGSTAVWENAQPLVLIPVAGTVNVVGFDETN